MTTQAVYLPRKLQSELVALAEATPGQEVCGLLGGTGHRFMSFYPVANIDPDARHAFFMEPREQLESMRQMRERGEQLRGIFHSHPDTPARPSERDRQQATYPDVYYLIVSLQTSPPDLGIYYYDGNRFIACRYRSA